MLIKVLQIINGWWNYIFKNLVIEALVKKRAKFCGPCEFVLEDTFSRVILPEPKNLEIQGKRCALCSCPLSTLLRASDAECKKKKW